jgi:hypothetical protein
MNLPIQDISARKPTRSICVIETVRAFGGFEEVARILNVSVQAVYKWRGSVPLKSALKLYAYAQKHNISKVTLQMMIPDHFPKANQIQSAQ